MRFLRASPLLFVFVIGCKVTSHSETKTGLFGDDPKKINEAYFNAENIEYGTGRIKDLQNIGFDFDAPNIEHVPGPLTFRRIFGENVFQNAITDPVKVGPLLQELNQYYGVFIPYRDEITESDRFPFSEKETRHTGEQLTIIFIFKRSPDKNDTLYYRDRQFVKIDSKEKEGAFAQGLLDFIDKYGKFGSNVKDLVEKLQDFLKKNRDNE